MRKIVDYSDDTRETIIAEQESLGLRLIEDQRYFDGNHLIFTDEPYPEEEGSPVMDLTDEINGLKARIEKLEKR